MEIDQWEGLSIIREGLTSIINIRFDCRKMVISILLAAGATYLFAVSEVNIMFVLVAEALFLVFPNIKINVPENNKKLTFVMISTASACMVILMSQKMMSAGISTIITNGLVMNMAICLFFIIICSFIIGSVVKGSVIGSVLLMLFATVDYAVYDFRGFELSPFDIIAIKTAINVAQGYEFQPNADFVVAWIVILLMSILITDVDIGRIDRKKSIKAFGSFCAVQIAVIVLLTNTMSSYHWGNGGALFRGIYTNFVLEIPECIVVKPSGYNVKKMEEEIKEYSMIKTQAEKTPDIIVIMNESFADLQRFDSHFETNEQIMPFFKSLEKNVVRGYALTSVYGGGTSSSEFEFLTGNTMAFLPNGSIPYQQFVYKDMYSMVSVLKSLGYKCEAMHPYYSDGWSRDKVYSMLGFDETLFIEDFSEDDLIRGFVSDRSMYKTLMKRYDKRDKTKPLFIFGVTMQNHGGYGDEDYKNHINIIGHEGEYPEAEQYLSLINQSDAALKKLIDFFKKKDPVIVVFFGDHLPALPDEFYEFANNEEMDRGTLESKIKAYEVPFAIWANYEIETRDVNITSLNYLSNYVYEAAGIHTPYSEFLEDISVKIPALNSLGYYSLSENKFMALKTAKGEEREALDLYRRLQYNNVIDYKNRMPMFVIR